MVILALLLSVQDVQAATWPPKTRRTSIVMTRTVTTTIRPSFSIAMPNTGVASAEAVLTSADGTETVVLKPNGVRLHGVAALADAGPAAVAITAYDELGAPVGKWAGRLDELGRLSVAAEPGAMSLSSTGAVKGADGLVLPLAFAGADAGDIVSASVDVVTEDFEDVCDGDVCWSEPVTVVTSAEVALDEADALWSAESLLAGPVDVKVTAYDVRGKKLGSVKATVADDGAAFDDDPATWLTLGMYAGAPALTFVSAGWTATDVVASIDASELVTGTPGVLRQTVGTSAAWDPKLDAWLLGNKATVTIALDGGAFQAAGRSTFTVAELTEPVCGPSWCVGRSGASATSIDVWAYGPSNATLPTSVKLGLTFTVGAETFAGSSVVAMSDEHVFTGTLGVAASGDVASSALAGKVKLKGPPDRKGRADTLVSGKVSGVVVEGADGWSLGATAKSDVPPDDRGVLVGTSAPAVLAKAGPSVLCGGGYTQLCRQNVARAYSPSGK